MQIRSLGISLIVLTLGSGCGSGDRSLPASSQAQELTKKPPSWLLENDDAVYAGPKGRGNKTEKKGPIDVKSLDFSVNFGSSGYGGKTSVDASNTIDLGGLTVRAHDSASVKSNMAGIGATYSQQLASFSDTVQVEGKGKKGTLKPFKLELYVNSAKALGGGNGQYSLALELTAVVEDVLRERATEVFQRCVNTLGSCSDQGVTGPNDLIVKLPLGYGLYISGSLSDTAVAAVSNTFQSASVIGDADATVCLIPPPGVSLISASGHIWRRC